jgi:hypothetical protein
MRIINTADPRPTDKLGLLATYSGMDVLSLFEIRDGIFAEMTPLQKSTYTYEMELQAALLEMSLNGTPVDQTKRADLITSYELRQQNLNQLLHQFCTAIGYYTYYIRIAQLRYSELTGVDPDLLPSTWQEWKELPRDIKSSWKSTRPDALPEFHKALKEFSQPFNGNSYHQKIRLFYHFFGIKSNAISTLSYPDFPPPWPTTKGIREVKGRKTDGTFGPSVDRDALEKLQKKATDPDTAYFWAQPFISCCLALADCTKALGFLRCQLEDGYFRASFGAVTETGRLNSKENAQGFGSNFQNVTPDLRVIFTSPDGWKSATPDYEQIESRNVGAICFTLFGATDYLDACECGDLHTLVCSMIWPDLPWPSEFNFNYVKKYGKFPKELIKPAKKIASEKFYRHFSRRDLSKRGGHGSNYLGKPPHMAKMLHVEKELMEHYQSAYFEIFPEIPQWHQWTIEQVQTKQELTTIFGRTRRFFGRPSDDATIREAVAFCPQSMAADYTNAALIKLQRAILYEGLPIKLFLQKHDEIGFRFKEADQEVAINRACGIMEQSITLTAPDGKTRKWAVPVEALTGWNLGHASKTNPDGLIEWTGSDPRVRTSNPFNPFNFKIEHKRGH